MIIEELAYKITIQTEEFLSGKKKVEDGLKGLGKKASDAMEDTDDRVKKSGAGVKKFGDQVKKTAEDTKRPFGVISSGFFKAAKGAKDFGKEGSEAFGGVSAGAAKFLGLAVGIEATRRLFVSSTKSLVDLGNVSSFLDLDPRVVDGWKKGAESVGSSSQAMTGALLKLKNASSQMGGGGIPPDSFTQALVQLDSETNHKFDIFKTKDPSEMFKRTEQALRKLNKERAISYMNMLGWHSSMLPSILDKSLDKKQSEFQGRSNASDEMIRRGREVNEMMTKLDQSTVNLGNDLVLAFGPSIVHAMDDFSNWIDNHKDNVIGFFQTGERWAKKFSDAVGGSSNAMEILIGLYASKKVSGLLGKGVVGRAGVAGVAAAVSEPVVDALLNRFFGKNDYFQSVRTASSWSDFGNAILGQGGGAHWEGGKWIDPRNQPEQYAQSVKRKDSNQFGRDALLDALMMTESSGNPNAVSSAGAVGLYGIMPATGRDLGLSQEELKDPEKSREAASRYLNSLLNHYGGNMQLALMAYNAGMGRIDNYLQGKGKPLTQETMNYPGTVLEYYRQLSQLAGRPNMATYPQSIDNSQKASTYINNVHVQGTPQSVDAIQKSIEDQLRRSSMTGAFISGNG
ncbi:lytic transglycosylase domain-containing protein [Enterobacteriaceae bacterium LUAb1]